MGQYVAEVGDIIIKEEYRKDFGHLFREEYDKLESGIIADYAKEYYIDHVKHGHDPLMPVREWKHMDYKESWRGKFQTEYDEETGRFTYGMVYNRRGAYFEPMYTMFYLLLEITEEELWYDSVDDGG